jgi:hypothetical protein
MVAGICFGLFFLFVLLGICLVRKHQRKILLRQPAVVVIQPLPSVTSASNPSNDV